MHGRWHNMVDYNYNNDDINTQTLKFEILESTITKELSSIKYTSPSLTVSFNESLSTEEEATLDDIVDNHSGVSLTEGSLLCNLCEEYTCGNSIGTPTKCYVCGATGENISDIYEHPSYFQCLSADGTLWKHYQRNDGLIRVAKCGEP